MPELAEKTIQDVYLSLLTKRNNIKIDLPQEVQKKNEDLPFDIYFI